MKFEPRLLRVLLQAVKGMNNLQGVVLSIAPLVVKHGDSKVVEEYQKATGAVAEDVKLALEEMQALLDDMKKNEPGS